MSLQKLPKNVRDLGKLIVAKGLKKLPKVQKTAQSGHTGEGIVGGRVRFVRNAFSQSQNERLLNFIFKFSVKFYKKSQIQNTNSSVNQTNQFKSETCKLLESGKAATMVVKDECWAIMAPKFNYLIIFSKNTLTYI